MYSQSDTNLPTVATEDLVPWFPRLRKLRIYRSMKFAGWSMFNALIHDGLRTLWIAMEFSPVVSAYFQQRGTLPALTWSSFDVAEFHSLNFLQANPHLTALAILAIQSKVPDGTRLLSSVSRSFKQPKSLWIRDWTHILCSKEALDFIRILKSLEQLHLSVVEQLDRPSDMVRTYLGELPCLKRSTITRDPYDNWMLFRSNKEWYRHRWLTSESGDPDWVELLE
ncbi:hypothetical protein N7G274_004753 [Stereocaulon virgatum]|uniref:Uncharacterized protein n=1 Tax=Stereocaulon virgatum TaxID=373712 RepID=A0ABR4A9Y5_9LECA